MLDAASTKKATSSKGSSPGQPGHELENRGSGGDGHKDTTATAQGRSGRGFNRIRPAARSSSSRGTGRGQHQKSHELGTFTRPAGGASSQTKQPGRTGSGQRPDPAAAVVLDAASTTKTRARRDPAPASRGRGSLKDCAPDRVYLLVSAAALLCHRALAP